MDLVPQKWSQGLFEGVPTYSAFGKVVLREREVRFVPSLSCAFQPGNGVGDFDLDVFGIVWARSEYALACERKHVQ